MLNAIVTAEPDVVVAPAADATPALEATALSRRYGDGENAVHALRGV